MQQDLDDPRTGVRSADFAARTTSCSTKCRSSMRAKWFSRACAGCSMTRWPPSGGRRHWCGCAGTRAWRPGYQPVHRDAASSVSWSRWPSRASSIPRRAEIETELGRNSNYVDGIAQLFKKYGLQGWEPAYDETQERSWPTTTPGCASNILPKARTDFRLPPEKYALAFRGVRHRHPAGADRRHGARGLHAVPGGDGAARRAGGQGQPLSLAATIAP